MFYYDERGRERPINEEDAEPAPRRRQAYAQRLAANRDPDRPERVAIRNEWRRWMAWYKRKKAGLDAGSMPPIPRLRPPRRR